MTSRSVSTHQPPGAPEHEDLLRAVAAEIGLTLADEAPLLTLCPGPIYRFALTSGGYYATNELPVAAFRDAATLRGALLPWALMHEERERELRRVRGQ